MKTLFFILIACVAQPCRAQARELDFSPRARDANDMRTIAPAKPDDNDWIAQPLSGTDLGSVSSDWARRQIHLSTNGADEQFMNAANKKLDALFASPNVNGYGNVNGKQSATRSPASTDSVSLKPRSVHMSRLGEFEMGFAGQTKITCDLVNGSELTLSKPILQDIDLRLHHESTMNTLQLQFSW